MSGRGAVTSEIKKRINIIDIVKRYVELRRAGNRWVAPCPFHQETKPSFSVNEEEGFFYCFGCQAAGDVFDFYSRINGLDFKETLAHLAEEAGVSLAEMRPSPRVAAERDSRKLAVKMYEFAQGHFKQNLKSAAGKNAREYLAKRELDTTIIEGFGIGWSLPDWHGLESALKRAGFKPEQGVEVGLLAPSDRGGAYDRFRGRLIFPISNLSGQVIAFGGRIIADEDAAKYINSTDSPLYKKGDNLYGLFQSRRTISAQKSVILTEGYMDVLTLHQFGYTNACGVLGTALTPEQVRRLAGFCSDIELIFDGDAPGRKAALKACEMVLTKGLRCKVVMLPDKEDIDSLLHGSGKAAFEDLRKFSPDGLDFCIRTLSTHAPKDALAWVQGFITAVEQPELLSRFISRLCQGLDIDEREVRRVVADKLPQTASSGRGNMGLLAQGVSASSMKNNLEKEILKYVVRYPHHVPALENAGANLIFSERWAQTLWGKVASCAPTFELEAILHLLAADEKEFWGRYRVMEAPPFEKEQEELADVCALITRLCLEKQDLACTQALKQSSHKDDFDLEMLRALDQSLAKKRTLGEL